MAEVAYNPEDIKSRLAGVPVYAVINQKEEFVLISGEGVWSPCHEQRRRWYGPAHICYMRRLLVPVSFGDSHLHGLCGAC